MIKPEWLTRARWELWSLLFVVFACYGRCLTWSWLDFDDRTFERLSPFWGAAYTNHAPLLAALTDGINHRWLPVFNLALFFIPRTLLALHCVVFGFAVAIALAVREVAIRYAGPVWGFWVAAAWVAQPARLEIFGWTMGLVYELMIFALLMSFLARGTLAAAVWSCVSLASYPAAAGAVLLLGLLAGPGWRRYSLFAVVFGVAVVDFLFRAHGFTEFRPIRLPVWIEFEAFALVFPFPPSPVLPPMPSVVIALAAGAAICVFWRRIPGIAAAVVLASAPVFFAAVYEPFWLASRYLAVPQLVFFLGVARLFAKYEVSRPVLWYVGLSASVCVGCFYLGDYVSTCHASYGLSATLLQHPDRSWWDFKERPFAWTQQ